MKKKNILVAALSLVLVAAVSIGGTLAYLTATDDAVTNTFTFANNMAVDLTEPQPAPTGAEEITGSTEAGWSYTNVVPGQALNKAPAIKATTTVPAFVFARVTRDEHMLISGWNTGDEGAWKTLGTPATADGMTTTILYREINASDASAVTLFDQIQVPAENLSGETKVTLPDTKIEVSMIQSSGFAGDTEAARAAAAFEKAKDNFKITNSEDA